MKPDVRSASDRLVGRAGAVPSMASSLSDPRPAPSSVPRRDHDRPQIKAPCFDNAAPRPQNRTLNLGPRRGLGGVGQPRSGPLWLALVPLQPVADARFGQDVLRAFGVPLQLLPQLPP